MKAGAEKQAPQTDAFEQQFQTRRPIRQTAGWVLALGLVFVGVALLFPDASVLRGGRLYLSIGLGITLLCLCAIDLDRFLLPDLLTLPLIALGLLYSSVYGVGLPLALLGMSLGYGLIAGLAWYWRTRLDREGIGLGDAKLLAAIGAWCGVLDLPFVLLIASTLTLTVSVLISRVTKTDLEALVVPFGPALCLGFWIVWIAELSALAVGI